MIKKNSTIKNSDDLVGAIAHNLNESVETPASLKGEHKCAVCGATYTVDTDEYGAAVCPVCGTVPGNANADIDQQDVVDGMEELAQEYADAISNEDFDEANRIAEKCDKDDTKIVTESLDDGSTGIVLEKMIKTIDASGKITKVKVKTKKKRLTSGQKQALRKARKMAHKGGANRKRKKAMKMRRRKGLSESIIARNIGILAESLGRTPNAPEISSMTSKLNLVMEALDPSTEQSKIADVITGSFQDRNIGVVDITPGTQGTALTFDIVLEDNPDEEVYLGEVADEVEHALGNYVIAYEDPTTNEDGDVEVRFVAVDSTNESCKNESDDECDSDNCDDADKCDTMPTHESYHRRSRRSRRTNESVQVNVGDEDDDAIDSIAGGQSNILCEIDPQFLKVGQTAYDSDDKTAFTVLTAPEEVDEGFRFSAEIIKSANQELAILPRGTKITVTPDTEYFLLRKAPLQ